MTAVEVGEVVTLTEPDSEPALLVDLAPSRVVQCLLDVE